MKFRLLLCLLLSTLFCRADDYEARTQTGADGGTLPYRLMRPVKFDATQKYPLVILLHGAGERGNDNKAQLKHGGSLFAKPEVRQKFPAFVLVPQCPPDPKKWVEIDWGAPDPVQPADPGTTQGLLLEAVTALKKEFPIDEDRVYVTGLSMGGYGTWDLITRYPDMFAAAAPICGGGDKRKIVVAKNVPIWAFHGAADGVVKPARSRELVEALKAAGSTVAYTEYPGVQHDSWTTVFSEPNYLPWLFAQKRGTPAKMELAVSPYTMLAMPPENVFAGSGPLQLADWFKKLWMNRRVEFQSKRQEEQGAVVFLGDSITHGWGSLSKDFPQFKTANRGISGDTSRGVRYRLKEDVLDLNPKAVSLLIGTNDLALGGEPEQVIDNIKAIIAELQKQNANVPIIVNRVMPRGPQEGKFPVKIQKLNGLIDELAVKDTRITICDTWSIFDDGTGSCKKEEFPDMLHPNPAGYAKWRAALTEAFGKRKL